MEQIVEAELAEEGDVNVKSKNHYHLSFIVTFNDSVDLKDPTNDKDKSTSWF